MKKNYNFQSLLVLCFVLKMFVSFVRSKTPKVVSKDEMHLGTTCVRGIIMKRSMVLDQGEIKDERSLGTTHLEEIR